ncbi:MAG: toll/interleukin-1 receptor domain-containing protein [Bacteroidota bacterium]
MSPGIFISYRRSDTKAFAERIAGALSKEFSSDQVFFDEKSIDPGDLFFKKIVQEITNRSYFILLLGPSWLESMKERNRSDFNREDIHFQEILKAKEHDRIIIPVLVNSTSMFHKDELPEELVFLPSHNAISIDEANFNQKMQDLISFIKRKQSQIEFQNLENKSQIEIQKLKNTRNYSLSGLVVALLFAFIVIYFFQNDAPIFPRDAISSVDSSSVPQKDSQPPPERDTVIENSSTPVTPDNSNANPSQPTNAQANFDMGYNYLHGLEGVEQNFNSAQSYFERAAQEGHAEAQYALGLFFLEGLNGTPDPELAESWLKKAVSKRHVKSMVVLAQLYGEQNNCSDSVSLLKRAATLGDANAQNTIDSLKENRLCVEYF